MIKYTFNQNQRKHATKKDKKNISSIIITLYIVTAHKIKTQQ